MTHIKYQSFTLFLISRSEGGPCARSGHRMVLSKRHLVLFGGFQDNTHNYQYFNDLYAFSLADYKWKIIKTSGMI